MDSNCFEITISSINFKILSIELIEYGVFLSFSNRFVILIKFFDYNHQK